MTISNEALTLRVRNALESISAATKSAEEWLTKQQVSSDVSFFAVLAIDELVSNCVKYGYDDEAEHYIEITLSAEGQSLTMLVVDDGHAFDPLSAPRPDLSLAVEDRPIGGLGLHLLRELADQIFYQRYNETNRLTLIKKLA